MLAGSQPACPAFRGGRALSPIALATAAQGMTKAQQTRLRRALAKNRHTVEGNKDSSTQGFSDGIDKGNKDSKCGSSGLTGGRQGTNTSGEEDKSHSSSGLTGVNKVNNASNEHDSSGSSSGADKGNNDSNQKFF